MKCIVSGGSGFIGRKLVDSLVENGHQVAIWSRHPGQEKRNAVESFCWDPMQGEPQEESLNGFDAVVHLAGEPVAQRWSPEVKCRIRDSRTLGTQNLVRAIAKVRHKPAVLVCASAVGFYGSRGDELLTESATAGSGFLAKACQGWEQAADGASALGLRVAKIRIGIVLGKDGGALPAMLPAFHAFAGGTMGSGKQWMPWIHVHDLVEMFRHAVETPVTGVWNGTAQQPVTNAQFTVALGKALHRPALLRIPEFAVRMLMGEMGGVVFDSQRVIPQAVEAAGFFWKYTELGEALRNLLN